jgi:hypothetical protein
MGVPWPEDGAARALVRRLASLPEAAMRTVSLAEVLAAWDAAACVRGLEALLTGARAGDGACLSVYAGMVDPEPLARALGEARRVALLQAAEACACRLALQWLLTAGAASADAAAEDGERLVHRELRKLTLGERRALARRARGERLKQLLMDPDPGVIDNLLNNPRTTEEVVLGICARRPTIAAPLVRVAHAPRWIGHYRVKLALVCNPFTPTHLAVNLLMYLTTRDVRAVADDAALRPALRLAAQRLLNVGRLYQAIG